MFKNSIAALALCFALVRPDLAFSQPNGAGGSDEGKLGAADVEAVPGTLSGIVVNLGNGSPLAGAVVRAAKIDAVATTDMDGIFNLKLPAGQYDLRITMDGFREQQVNGVQVKPSETTFQDVAVAPLGLDLGQVTVVAESEKASQIALLAERRTAAALTDAIGSQEISKSTGGDAADVIQRVTGVTVVDGRYVYVRGLGERYSGTMLNGSIVPSTQPDRKVVPLDLFPASLLQNIQTEKSYTPDKPGEFAGGLVKLSTVDFPRAPTVKVSVGQGFGTLTTFEDFMGYRGGSYDFLGFDNGARALPSVIPSERLVRGNRFSPGGFTPEQLRVFGQAFSNVWEPRSEGSAIPNQKFNFTAGNTFGKLGVVAAVAHANNFQNRDEAQTIYRVGSEGISPFNVYDFKTSTASTRSGAAVNLGYQVAENHRVLWRNFYSHDSSDEARVFEGFNADFGNPIRDLRLRFTEESVFSSQVSGEHNLKVFGNSLLEWQVTRSRSTLDEPDLRETLYEFNPSVGRFVLADESQSGFRQFSGLAERLWEPQLAWSAFFTRNRFLGSVKVGGSYRWRDRDFSARRFRFLPRRTRGLDLTLPPERIFTFENIRPDGFEIREETRPTDAYAAREMTRAGFAMGDLTFGRWRLVGGLRIESDSLDVTSFDPFNRDVLRETSSKQQNTDLLPGVNVIFRLSPNMNVRGSASRTLNRPEFRELATFEFTDVVGGRSVVGNPDLRRARINNYDVRWEWFPSAAEILSASFFYKKFENPIERVVQPTAQLRTSFVNADSANNFGFELDFRRNLGFLSESLRRLSVAANYTWVDSTIDIGDRDLVVLTTLSRPLAGQSRHALNAVLEYESPGSGMLARLLFNYQGRRITDVGSFGLPDIYEEGYPRLDAVLVQPLGASRKWGLKVSAENLVDREVRYTQGGEPFRTYKNGRVFGVTLSYSFFQQ